MSHSESWQSHHPTHRSIPHTNAEICVNCWYFVDATGVVIRLAAKAYALAGTDEDKLLALKLLAGTDHLTAIQAKVPQKYVIAIDHGDLRGAIHASVLSMDPIPVFDELFEQLNASLPSLIQSVDDTYQSFRMQLTEPFLWVLTCVFEDQDGNLVARIS